MVQICDRDKIKTMHAERESEMKEKEREREEKKERNERKSCVIKNVLNSSSVIVNKTDNMIQVNI